MIHDVHTEGEIRLGWMYADGWQGSAPCGRPHRKLEHTDVILSYSHAKKLAEFCTKISSLQGIKVAIFRQYKLLV